MGKSLEERAERDIVLCCVVLEVEWGGGWKSEEGRKEGKRKEERKERKKRSMEIGKGKGKQENQQKKKRGNGCNFEF